ncbi:helix-turn-helix domain-containing protein [Nocardia flavorosea]|nr:helix-turn-helix domain-containing protein [Nocardia flavorosea]
MIRRPQAMEFYRQIFGGVRYGKATRGSAPRRRARSSGLKRKPEFSARWPTTRRQILQDLRPGELTAGDIASNLPIRGPSISRPLGVLEADGLVRERRVANRIFYSLVEERLALCVGRFLSAVCPERSSSDSADREPRTAATR